MDGKERVAIVVDGGSSMRQEYPEVAARGVVVMPLDLQFLENGRLVSYSGSKITDSDFYRRMRESKVLPQTSGAVIGRAAEIFAGLGKETNDVVSIHITARHSVSWESAREGAKIAEEQNPGLRVRVIDSKTISATTWFLAEQAAELSQSGATAEEIERVTLETIPKLEVDVVLATMINVVKGGRVLPLVGWIGARLGINPILNISAETDGEIRPSTRVRTMNAGRRELVKRAREKGGEIERLAILHTNDLAGAEILAELVGEFYPREKIRIYEAGPVIGVHAGERALAIATQRK